MSGAEAPLITEEAPERGAPSSGTRLGGVGAQGSKKYRRRSDALAYGDRYQKAAALVDLVGSHSSPRSLSFSHLLALLQFCSASLSSALFALHGSRNYCARVAGSEALDVSSPKVLGGLSVFLDAFVVPNFAYRGHHLTCQCQYANVLSCF
jgi:hypothetical protein